MATNRTLLLDTVAWDLVLDASGNIAVATEPYSLAQDAASAIRTFLGECYLDTTVGVDWLGLILGQAPPLQLLKQLLANAAKTVQDVDPGSVLIFITAVSGRNVSGQVQVTSASTGQTSAANFSLLALQGV
jgi:hypothetical protein